MRSSLVRPWLHWDLVCGGQSFHVPVGRWKGPMLGTCLYVHAPWVQKNMPNPHVLSEEKINQFFYFEEMRPYLIISLFALLYKET